MKTGKILFRLQTCQGETLIYSYTLILVYFYWIMTILRIELYS